jgi:hypothetical protein
LGNTEFVDNCFIGSNRPITRDRSHGQLCKSRYSKLANDKDIQGKAQRKGNFIGYWHTAAWQPEDDSILKVTPGRGFQDGACQYPAGISAVLKYPLP